MNNSSSPARNQSAGTSRDLDISPEFASEVAADHFGLRGEATPLVGYAEKNFRVEGEHGPVVLKFGLATEVQDRWHFQANLLGHLADTDPDLPVQRVLPPTAGGTSASLKTAQGTILVRALTWLDGVPLDDDQALPLPLLEEFGALLGRMANALGPFSDHGALALHEWAIERTPDCWDLLPNLPSVFDRESVARALRGYDRISESLSRLPKAVIHGDGNHHNLLATNGHPSGVIDFGDAHVGPVVAELAIACAYLAMNAEEIVGALAAVTRGFCRERPLSAEECGVLLPLIRARLAMSVCHSATHRAKGNDDPYLSISEALAWTTLRRLEKSSSPQARLRLRDAAGLSKSESEESERIQDVRSRNLPEVLSLSYNEPLHIVDGIGAYLLDTEGRAYLDMVNNVCHIGHSHPKVVGALSRQAKRLNTNTRYLHSNIVGYAERLLRHIPSPLSVCFFVNSGSEANDLALRLARTHTGRKDVVVLDGAYHGHLTSLIEISPYKHSGPGGAGTPDFVHPVPVPDPYRGKFRSPDGSATSPDTGLAYANEVSAVLANMDAPPAAFICETLLGVGGQVELPETYLQHAFAAARSAGAVCIADEVQVGFGRVGTHFWGFETQEVVPDIVTLGKPIGNGHPLAAVVTTPEIARSFANGMEYFNTFGGNPVSCAVGLAVLDVIEEEGLQAWALSVGNRLQDGLRFLKQKYELIGNVRGRGLFVGAELVRDRETLEPATAEAKAIVEAMKAQGILLSTDGPHNNVLKIKPPLVFSHDDADRFLGELDKTLGGMQG